ncbi:bacterial regulatory s, tetR family protein [Mycolicibacterium hassiacum DSM 44199]|jgi:AcrR family transcriptional regulator|uniref:Bacterial regulatory s, tetR family protein n=3 Tax=Mycolicibacterium hassiacum TaxID=46351 RepID=K5B7B7_MYCHD|nr:TetR/AcrR family transcriptional regulator [Mycolicibacterium hassiacum]EKF21668.1 bacterial regulatory s, tetR family protein [Mycolicibacterium hassiacum DSM 44199]MDA4084242.1 TetR family transcriptional regulator [Mycolicibacterium hassiacum DSM 44199]PZN25076.1 MAG: TetR/AcrR family transcriptional regulator [Mycolicibacterium hassiacum]VCT91251.1 Biofilm operon icaADBC HTH-type negative transcriptional regulator IcaR [Mycolicibacterium hassiacum DSM 44199]
MPESPSRNRRDGTVRRPGYAASADSPVGRRGAKTRALIKSTAATLFTTNGFHGTSIDDIARSLGGSRATVYQYFANKDQIYAEMVGDCQQAVLDHVHGLGPLGPDDAGLEALRRWLRGWSDIYDSYAAVFLEFPAIGALDSVRVGDPARILTVVKEVHEVIADRLARAGVVGMDPLVASAVLTRIAHMVNLYRYRGMFDMPDRDATAAAVAATLQRIFFPEGGSDVDVPPRSGEPTPAPPATVLTATDARRSPVREDVLTVSSALFAERGYHGVGMEEIAAAAGISRATLYRHFNSKARILAELTDVAIDRTRELALELTAIADNGLDTGRLHDWILRFVVLHRRFHGVTRAWFDGAVIEELGETNILRSINALRDAADAVVAQLDLPDDTDPIIATGVVLAVLGRMTEPLEWAPDDPEYAAELILRILWRCLLRFQRT